MARVKHGLPGVYNASVLTLTDEEGAAVGLSVRGFTIIEGNIADNGADSGNPIKVGGKYNSTLPTYADGDRGNLQIDSRGRLIIALEAADLEIGSVELKNYDTDDRQAVDTSHRASVKGYLDAATDLGATPLFDADGDNTPQQVKASAGAIYAIEVSNPNAADAYLQLFDVANGSITVGTTAPNLSFLVPAGDGTKDGAMDKIFTIPIKFGTAVNYACTTTATGNGDPSTGLIVNILYK